MALKSESSNAKLKLIDDANNLGLEVSYDGANASINKTGAGDLNIVSSTVDMSGNLTIGGTVDGRDVATDGTKLDGVATGATNVTNNNQLTNGSSYSKVFNQSAAPTSGFVVGDIWFDTTSDIISIAGDIEGTLQWIGV